MATGLHNITKIRRMLASTAPVLVTGATGFVAAEIVRQLLEAGYSVRGTTRNVTQAVQDGHLTDLPGAAERLELVEADLVEPGAFDEAVVGCEYVIHTASPYVLDVEDPQRDLVDPAVQGTLSVLESAAKTTAVKRVVLTSSFAAVSGGAKDGIWTEKDWNTTSSLDSGAYAYSKTMAEKVAWQFVDDNDVPFDLVVINPTGVLGPSIVSRVNQTHQIFVSMAHGEYPGIIGIEFPFVDVRDVAMAHIKAMENPDAGGRHITSAGSRSFRRLVELARDQGWGEKYKLPRIGLDNSVGNAVVKFAANFQPKGTRDFLKGSVGKTYELDTSKITSELGIEFRDLDVSIGDAFSDLERWGHLEPETSAPE